MGAWLEAGRCRSYAGGQGGRGRGRHSGSVLSNMCSLENQHNIACSKNYLHKYTLIGRFFTIDKQTKEYIYS